MADVRIRKYPNEHRDYRFDCSYLPEIVGGETIDSAVYTEPAGIVIHSIAIDGNVLVLNVSGGTAGTNYFVDIDCTMSDDSIVTVCVEFAITDCA